MRTKGLIVIPFLVALLAGCDDSARTTQPTPPGVATTVSIVAGASTQTTAAWSPNPVTITAGGAVQWLNNDTTTHMPAANDGSWTAGNVAPGGTFNQAFPTAGTYGYHCAIHPNMVGTITVNPTQ